MEKSKGYNREEFISEDKTDKKKNRDSFNDDDG